MSLDDDEFDHLGRLNLAKLTSLRDNVNWELEDERHEFLRQLEPIIERWTGRLPNLRDVFREEVFELLLFDSLKYRAGNADNYVEEPFVRFVARTGYKDRPKLDENGEVILRRPTPVHLAANFCPSQWHTERIVGNLFRIYDRYDANYVDDCGYTHFHAACESGCYEIAERFLVIGRQDPNLLATESGDTPLNAAMTRGNRRVVELLLRHGADPNLANAQGMTPLHTACLEGEEYTEGLVESFMRFNDDLGQVVRVDAREKNRDWTPLQWVAHWKYQRDENIKKKLVELLLRRGSDPNLASKHGESPLRVICTSDNFDDDLAEVFFETNDDLRQTVQVDARNGLYQTPLQCAVARCMPITVDVLLARGADLSSFVFPNDYFGLGLEKWRFDSTFDFLLRLGSGAMAVVDSLEKKGYELDRNDAMTVMEFFAERRLFAKSADYENLMRSRPEWLEKLLTYRDYFDLARSNKLWQLPERYREVCAVNLCEKLSRGFFQRWALDSLVELTRYQLPILCCEVIIGKLMNEDLWHVCLAAATEDGL